MPKPFNEMTIEELRQFMHNHRGEDIEEEAFNEYYTRCEWKPLCSKNATVEEVGQAVDRLISEKTKWQRSPQAPLALLNFPESCGYLLELSSGKVLARLEI